jgi:arginase
MGRGTDRVERAPWELAGVPYTSMREPGGIAEAIAALRERGLAERLRAVGVDDGGDLRLEPPSAERGGSGLLNESALVRLVEATSEYVGYAHRAGRRPLLVGGDCPVLLGAVAALGDGEGSVGLVMVDGHEDAWPPHRSNTGEASDSEIAIALGRVPDLPGPLERLTPVLRPSSVALVGPRDGDEIKRARVESLRDEVAFFADDVAAARTLASGGNPAQDAIQSIDADEFWLHVDLDALDSHAFAAVDYPQPGGLDWYELEQLVTAAATAPGCRGMSVGIYNPDLDPSRSDADELIRFLSHLLASNPRSSDGFK